MWTNSVWSRDNYDIALHRPGELDRPSNHVSGNGRPPAPPGVVSAWSTDTEDDEDENSDRASPLSRILRRTRRDAGDQKDEEPAPMPRVYAGAHRRRRCSSPEAGRNGADDGEQLRRQPNGVNLEAVPAPEPPKMSLLRETLFVTTICLAHLCARELDGPWQLSF